MNKFINMEAIVVYIKLIVAALLCAAFPTLPVLAILLLAHIVDVISALRLNSRLHRLDPVKYTDVKFSSEKFKEKVYTFGFEVIVIALILAIELVLLPTVPIALYTGYVMIGGQLVSILENESEKSTSKWAKWGNRIFKSKASRYLQEKIGVDADLID